MVSGFHEGSWVESTTSTKACSAKGYKAAPADGSWRSPSSSSEHLIPGLDQMDSTDQMDQINQMDQMEQMDQINQIDQMGQSMERLTSTQPDFEWVLR